MNTYIVIPDGRQEKPLVLTSYEQLLAALNDSSIVERDRVFRADLLGVARLQQKRRTVVSTHGSSKISGDWQ